MALGYCKLFSSMRSSFLMTHSVVRFCNKQQLGLKKEFRTENNIKYLEDPDTFGTLSGSSRIEVSGDEGDVKEEEFIQFKPLDNQKLTIKQYADLIKQYLQHKRLKEAIDILEVRMLKEDRVKPENYIYNILIGACADVGFTKKAFKLFNDMKRRALQPTGDTYTCLFESCANSPWPENGLKNAKHLRELMIEKGIEPNLTNYNTMIKAFGRCGDLITSFKLIDEMRAKKIKIRVHTFNHLLQACISDKETGLKHALILWRKMLKSREKPNIYSFNLLLRCVKDCNVGSKQDMIELINIIEDHIAIHNRNSKCQYVTSASISATTDHISNDSIDTIKQPQQEVFLQSETEQSLLPSVDMINNMECLGKIDKIQLLQKQSNVIKEEKMPNLLAAELKMEQVLDLKEVKTPQEKFAVVGGLKGFLEQMEVASVKPDIKTFTQILPLLSSTEEENKLLDYMKNLDVKSDIDFYNMLIKNRSMRREYDEAFNVMQLIKTEQEMRKKRYFLNKKKRLKVDIMTYGALALACNTLESGKKLIADMKDNQLKVNIQIMGALLRHGTSNLDFDYVLYIMDEVIRENLQPNDIFLKHLENFDDKCSNFIKQGKKAQNTLPRGFSKSYQNFSKMYDQWLKSVDIERALKTEYPWEQFKNPYPDTVQKQNIVIKEPKKFYKKSKKYFKYKPQLV